LHGVTAGYVQWKPGVRPGRRVNAEAINGEQFGAGQTDSRGSTGYEDYAGVAGYRHSYRHRLTPGGFPDPADIPLDWQRRVADAKWWFGLLWNLLVQCEEQG
jgi:hypothetical protein